MNFCNELALVNANDVIFKFEVIISHRAVNISSFIFINAQVLCTSRRQRTGYCFQVFYWKGIKLSDIIAFKLSDIIVHQVGYHLRQLNDAL